MAFSSTTFTGSISTTSANWTWCPVSATTVALFWIDSISGTVNDKYMMQLVTFNGSASPVFGDVCVIGTASTTEPTYALPVVEYIGNSQFLVATPAVVTSGQTTTWNINLVLMDANSRFYTASTSTTTVATANGQLAIVKTTDNNALILVQSSSTTTAYRTVSVSGTTATIGSATSINSGTGSASTSGFTTRRISPDGTAKLTMHIPSTTLSTVLTGFFSNLTQTSPTTTFNTQTQNGQLLRGLLALGPSTYALMGATTYTVFNSANTTLLAATAWRATGYQIQDCLWLDSTHLMVLCNSVVDSTSATSVVDDSAASARFTAANVYVMRYNPADYSFVPADTFPATFSSMLITDAKRDRCLFSIDNNNVAVITTMWDGTAGRIGVSLLSANAASSLNTISFVAAADAVYTTGGTSLSVTMPVSVATNDLSLAYVAHRSTVTPPDGWTLVATKSVQSADLSITQYMSVYKRTVVGGDAGTTISFSQASSDRMALSLSAYRGSKTSPVVKSSATSSVAEGAGTGGSYPAASVSTDAPGQMIVAGEASVYANTNNNFTVPSGFTQDTTSTISSGQVRLCTGHKSSNGENLSANFAYDTLTAMVCISVAIS